MQRQRSHKTCSAARKQQRVLKTSEKSRWLHAVVLPCKCAQLCILTLQKHLPHLTAPHIYPIMVCHTDRFPSLFNPRLSPSSQQNMFPAIFVFGVDFKILSEAMRCVYILLGCRYRCSMIRQWPAATTFTCSFDLSADPGTPATAAASLLRR